MDFNFISTSLLFALKNNAGDDCVPFCLLWLSCRWCESWHEPSTSCASTPSWQSCSTRLSFGRLDRWTTGSILRVCLAPTRRPKLEDILKCFSHFDRSSIFSHRIANNSFDLKYFLLLKTKEFSCSYQLLINAISFLRRRLQNGCVERLFISIFELVFLRWVRVIGDAKRNKVVIAQNQTRAALLRCASYASPVVLTIAAEQVIVNNEQWSLPLAVNVLKATLKYKENHGS